MAGSKEIGIGVASVLATGLGPDPFPLSFRGQSIEEAGRIVLHILTECRDAGITLKRVELDADLFREIAHEVDVPVRSSADLSGEVRFFRKGL
jgi:hypothetical protein